MSDHEQNTRRGFVASVVMAASLVGAYGVLGLQGLSFLLPKRLAPKRRLIFAGRVADYEIGGVRTVYDLEGTPILIKRTEAGFSAFDATCPHLGCKVHWEADNNRFFCPCHNGIFNAEGIGTGGPPGDAGQRLAEFPFEVDEVAGVIYLSVKNPEGRSA